MTSYDIILPSGKSFRVFAGKDQDRCEQIENLILKYWQDYCERNWLSKNHEAIDAPERKVKRLQDGCGYFILLGSAEGIVTDYKDVYNGKRELPISSCPSSVKALLFSSGPPGVVDARGEQEQFETMLERLDERAEAKKKAKPRPGALRQEPRQEKLWRIKKEYPGCSLEFCRVDTDWVFQHSGKKYRIDASVTAYGCVQTKSGVYYPMDKILVVTDCPGIRHYYTQSIEGIDGNLISEVT